MLLHPPSDYSPALLMVYKAEQETSCPLSAVSSVSTQDSDVYSQVQHHSSISGEETDTGFFC